jgi:hypothetical protein
MPFLVSLSQFSVRPNSLAHRIGWTLKGRSIISLKLPKVEINLWPGGSMSSTALPPKETVAKEVGSLASTLSNEMQTAALKKASIGSAG